MADAFRKHLPDLMRKVQSGDKAAYRQLLNDIGPTIHAYLRTRVFRKEDVDDVYQTILLKMHRSMHVYDANQPFEPWMFAIVRSMLFNYFRSVRKLNDQAASMQSGLGAGRSGDEGLVFTKMLEQLNPDQQLLLEMLTVKGLSYAEISALTGDREGTIRTRAHRVFEKVKQILGPDE